MRKAIQLRRAMALCWKMILAWPASARLVALAVAAMLILLPVLTVGAQSPQSVLWVRQFGTPSGDSAQAIAADASGVYVAGLTGGSLPGESNAGGGMNAFVRKYNAGGDELWTHQFGTSLPGEARAISVASHGVYVTGATEGAFSSDYTPLGFTDIFLRNYDADGNEQWTRQFGTMGIDRPYGISVDASGIYVAGEVGYILPGQVRAGDSDAFVRKYDPAGNVLWTRQFGTTAFDYAAGVSVDASGVYVVGLTGGAFSGYDSLGLYDIFLRKYDTDGNEEWTRQLGTLGYDIPSSASVNSTGVYVAGYTTGAFIPGQSNAGNYDAFVLKYDADGNILWTGQFGTTGSDYASGIATDASGVYVAGSTDGALPGQNSAGRSDAFVRKYDADGNGQWTLQFGTSNSDYTGAIAADAAALYLAGSTSGIFLGQISAGSNDAFIAKLGGNQPPVAAAGGPYDVQEGGSVTLDGSSTDPDGDPLTYAWDLDNNGSFETAGQNPAFSAAGLDGPGSQTVAVQVCDNQGACSQSGAVITIANVPPVLGPITGPVAPVRVNTTVTTTASFTDAGVLDTHSGIWGWGDNATSAGSISEVNGSGTISGTHIYGASNVYSVTLSLTDKDGGSSQSVYQYVVVYDPSGGFATGAGLIDSPAGAYTINPSLTGKATFGFVSRYQQGASVPIGQTQFRFQLAGLAFSSTSYQWLVVSGPKAQFKGSGAIDGNGDYGFLLTAIDGQAAGGGGVDKFRIKIWDNATGNTTYDNQIGSGDAADPATGIAGGNIVIQN